MSPDEVRYVFVAYVLPYKGFESPFIIAVCPAHLEVRISVIVGYRPPDTGSLTNGPVLSRQVRIALCKHVVQRFFVVPRSMHLSHILFA